jgi:TonB family protein
VPALRRIVTGMRVLSVVLAVALAGAAPSPLLAASSAGDDRLASLLGTWSCRDGANVPSTLTFSRERDAIVAKEAKVGPNGEPSTGTQRYRFDAAAGRWTVDDHLSAYADFHGTAPPWTGTEWNVEGTMTYRFAGMPSQRPRTIRYVRVGDGTLYRGNPDDRAGNRVSGEVCALGSVPPDPALCPAKTLPAMTVAAVQPFGAAGQSGTVSVRVTLDADSHVTGATVASSTNPALNADALAAARASRFRTEFRDCRPVPSAYLFTVETM